jgi:hypothetical protein
MSDELLGIGAFAMLSGLTVTALRHYDEIGLLRPAQVDGSSRYRFYTAPKRSSSTTVAGSASVPTRSPGNWWPSTA